MTTIITLKTNDDQVFRVESEVMSCSTTIRNMMNSDKDKDTEEKEEEIPVIEVNGETFGKVIIWAEHYTEVKAASESNTYVKSEWDENFFKMGNDPLYDLIRAANYLEMDELLRSACTKLGQILKGKKAPEIREAFGLPA